MLLIFFLLLGVLLFLHLVKIPALRASLTGRAVDSKAVRAGQLALCEALRGPLVVATATTGVLWLILWWATSRDGATVEELGGVLASLRDWRATLSSLSSTWMVVATLALLAGLSFRAYHAGKREMGQVLERLRARELERIRRQLDDGTFEMRPPNRTMERIAGRVATIREQVELGRAAEQATGERPEWLDEAEAIVHVGEQAYLAADVERRVAASVRPEDIAPPQPQTWVQRVQAFFYSRSSLATIRGATSLLALLLLVLTIPCLVGITSGVSDSALADRIGVATGKHAQKQVEMDELQFATSIEQAEDEWNEALAGLGSEVVKLDEQDLAAVDAIAVAIEDDLSDVDFLGAAAEELSEDESYSREAHAALVASSILRRAAERRAASVGFVPGLAELSDDAKRAVDLHRSARARKPRTAVGQRAADRLRQVARRSSSLRTKLRAYADGFKKPASAKAIRRALLANAIDGALGMGNSASRVASTLAENAAVQRQLQQRVNARVSQFATEVARTGDVEAARKRFARGPPGRPAIPRHNVGVVNAGLQAHARHHAIDRGRLSAALRERPPTLQVGRAARTRLDRATPSVQRLAQSLRARGASGWQAARLSAVLNRYGDVFPGQLGMESRTAAARLRTSHVPASASTARVSSRSFARARSFRGLRGFARVGGVIIGRLPAEEKDLPSVQDFAWTESGDRIRLRWRDEDGWKTSRWFRKSVVHDALVYAADGRLLAVTMTTAEPLSELRILVHPALVDTPMGQRVVELDRFVDVYTGEMEARSLASMCVSSHQNLYRFAWRSRLLAYREEFLQGEDSKAALMMAIGVEVDRTAATLTLDGEHSAQFRAWLDDPKRSPLTAKPKFFDRELVRWIIDAARGAGSVEAFEKEISRLASSRAKSISRAGHRAIEREVLRAIRPAPDLEIWSGVRETEYEGRLEEVGLGAQAGAMPFRFMLQTAFTSAPSFDGDGLMGEEEQEAFNDEHPWEFPAIGASVHDTVMKGLADPDSTQDRDNARDRAILNDVQEFVFAQRVFRLALGGQLGDGFPLEVLESLAIACAPNSAADAPTPRWNGQEGLLQHQLAQALFLPLLKLGRSEDASPRVQQAVRYLTAVRELAIEYVKEIEAIDTGSEGADRAASEARKRLAAKRTDWIRRWDRLMSQRPSIEGTENETLKEALATTKAIAMRLSIRRELEVFEDWARQRFRGSRPVVAPLR